MGKMAEDLYIFLNIDSKKFSDLEKGAAIRGVLDWETHNAFKKQWCWDVIRYLMLLGCGPDSEAPKGIPEKIPEEIKKGTTVPALLEYIRTLWGLAFEEAAE